MTSSASVFKASARLRTRRHSFHLDMTPMVGLAFLLLTFFLLHAGMAKPRLLQLTMPVKDGYYGQSRGELREYGLITVILGANHRLHYYYGLHNPLDSSVPVPELKSIDFGARGIRQVLLKQQQPVENIVLIKPAPGAIYKDVVDILDEMKITNQRQYALVKLTAADRQLLRANGQ